MIPHPAEFSSREWDALPCKARQLITRLQRQLEQTTSERDLTHQVLQAGALDLDEIMARMKAVAAERDALRIERDELRYKYAELQIQVQNLQISELAKGMKAIAEHFGLKPTTPRRTPDLKVVKPDPPSGGEPA